MHYHQNTEQQATIKQNKKARLLRFTLSSYHAKNIRLEVELFIVFSKDVTMQQGLEPRA